MRLCPLEERQPTELRNDKQHTDDRAGSSSFVVCGEAFSLLLFTPFPSSIVPVFLATFVRDSGSRGIQTSVYRQFCSLYSARSTTMLYPP
jgi:hypothetical protein